MVWLPFPKFGMGITNIEEPRREEKITILSEQVCSSATGKYWALFEGEAPFNKGGVLVL